MNEQQAFDGILGQIENTMGLFVLYVQKMNVKDRIDRILGRRGVAGYKAFWDIIRVRSDPHWYGQMVDAVIVHESYFFRDARLSYDSGKRLGYTILGDYDTSCYAYIALLTPVAILNFRLLSSNNYLFI